MGLGHLRGPGVSLGRILGVLSIEPLFGGEGGVRPGASIDPPPPPGNENPASPVPGGAPCPVWKGGRFQPPAGPGVPNPAPPTLFWMDHACLCRGLVCRGVPGRNTVMIGAVQHRPHSAVQGFGTAQFGPPIPRLSSAGRRPGARAVCRRLLASPIASPRALTPGGGLTPLGAAYYSLRLPSGSFNALPLGSGLTCSSPNNASFSSALGASFCGPIHRCSPPGMRMPWGWGDVHVPRRARLQASRARGNVSVFDGFFRFLSAAVHSRSGKRHPLRRRTQNGKDSDVSCGGSDCAPPKMPNLHCRVYDRRPSGRPPPPPRAAAGNDGKCARALCWR